MAWLAAAAPYIAAGAAAVTAISSWQQGNAAESAARAQAAQLRAKANEERAKAGQEAENIRLQNRLLQSRAQAVAAASGAGAQDPSVITLMGDLEEESEYRALSALWSGEESARTAEYAAQVAMEEGRNARQQSRINAVGGLLESAVSLYSVYGKTTPKKPSAFGGTNRHRGGQSSLIG